MRGKGRRLGVWEADGCWPGAMMSNFVPGLPMTATVALPAEAAFPAGGWVGLPGRWRAIPVLLPFPRLVCSLAWLVIGRVGRLLGLRVGGFGNCG